MTIGRRQKASPRTKTFGTYLKGNYDMYLMLLIPLAFYFIFKYVPIYGLVLAFKDYNFQKGIWGSPWAGLEVFEKLFRDRMFWLAIRNTLFLNLISLLAGFPIPIIFALLLNEVKHSKFKRVVQSISYLPHFISWVIFYGIIVALTAENTGVINILLKNTGFEQQSFLTKRGSWLFIYIFSSIWKETGWQAILYLSALSGIDQELYEAAEIDGAGRFKRIWHVTLPGIRSTIVTILILEIGKIMTIGFDKPYLLGNSMVSDMSTVLSTYIYTMGISKAQYAMTTAAGMFQSVINFVLVIGSDKIAKLLGEEGLFAMKVKKINKPARKRRR
ncbi:ABC transporter permease [Candidatus Acetatifactor stercoripullorum]|uniref:ABC transporter permease n=1 Tax=Candidatus Acetatifactor stercoripullorum TaxID=2838414 RepID=UPI00298DDCDD|nr:ABC transporter permease subunit [Candidatus Acetatifactor stercoripullorum]